MKKKVVVAHKHRRSYFPVTGTLVWWLAIDRLAPPSWVWGVFWTLAVLVWVAIAYDVAVHEIEERSPVWDKP